MGVDSKKVASAAAIGAGGLLAASVTVLGTAVGQGLYAKRLIGVRRESPPYADGHYGAAKGGTSLRFVMLGDSSAAGLGATSPLETVGARLAQGLVDASDSPVRYINMAVVGAQTSDLDQQVTRALEVRPHVVVVMIGGNDVTHLVSHRKSTECLGREVARLVEAGAEVIVGTCPDLGTVRPFKEPLRSIARVSSKQLAQQQAIAVVKNGGRAISLGSLLGPMFASDPQGMFAADQFHPSSIGYAKAAEVFLPSMLDALGLDPIDADVDNEPIDEGVSSVAVAADLANEDPGTELTALEDAEQPDGDRKYWVRALRRVKRPVRRAEKPEPLSEGDYFEDE